MTLVRRRYVPELLLVCLSLSVCGATYEVAQRNPKASDAGPGTREIPWKTVGQAARKVQSGDRVIVRSGVYREAVVLAVSGSSERPITFEAGPGEHVVMTG